MMMDFKGFVLVAIFIGYIEGFCPNGWIRDDDSCYFFHRELKTWDDASRSCKSAGGTLAVVETSAEETFLMNEIKYFEDAFNNDNRFWLDGSDRHKEGEWKWMSTGDPIKHFHWIDGKCCEDDEDCLEIRLYHDHVGWNDDQCDSKHNYICEIKDARTSPTTTSTTTTTTTTTATTQKQTTQPDSGSTEPIQFIIG